MRKTLTTLGLGLLLAAPAFAGEAPKSTAPVKTQSKVIKHHNKRVADDAKAGGGEAAKETPKKKPPKHPKTAKPADKPAEGGAPAK